MILILLNMCQYALVTTLNGYLLVCSTWHMIKKVHIKLLYERERERERERLNHSSTPGRPSKAKKNYKQKDLKKRFNIINHLSTIQCGPKYHQLSGPAWTQNLIQKELENAVYSPLGILILKYSSWQLFIGLLWNMSPMKSGKGVT